ncbi:MAG: hypothetical protein EHM47_01940 [Ignavibacteriales bacterium]|nr:MAG: hypothetical protein EHM47_01940 [Ignavibacteriales bacterium]
MYKQKRRICRKCFAQGMLKYIPAELK